MTAVARSLVALAVAAAVTSGEPAPAQKDRGPRYFKPLEFPTREERFESPVSVAADLNAGEIFVCDSRGRQIVIYDRFGVFRYRVSSGEAYRAPIDIAIDPEGFLFVLAMRYPDAVIALLDFDGLFLEEIPVPVDPDSDRAPDPVSLAISPAGDRLYIADQGTNRLWVTERDGTILGSADLAEGLTDEEKGQQILGHVDVYGDTVLVAIPFSGAVRLFDLDGNAKGQVGVKGTKPCQCGLPIAAAMDRDGNVLVADKQRMLLTRWDPQDNRCLGEHLGIGISPGFLYSPNDIALDTRGRLYISQGYEGRVQVFEGFPPARAPAPEGADPNLPRASSNP